MVRWRAGARIAAPTPPTPAPAPPHAPRAARRHSLRLRPCSARKLPPNEEQRRGEGSKLPKTVLLRAGAALFALGFVDAGYSGDWSRIGAISKDAEELLKLGAYAVVPLSLAFILSVSDDKSEGSGN